MSEVIELGPGDVEPPPFGPGGAVGFLIGMGRVRRGLVHLLDLERMLAADGILLGSPTYFSDVTTEMKALIDRCGFVAKQNRDMFRRKVGAAVVAVRRAGSTHAFDTMNHFFTISQMIVPGSSYWNMGIGLEKGDVEKDEEGMRTMKVLGENMAWLLKKLG